jgi:class 3 adenylate cyclase
LDESTDFPGAVVTDNRVERRLAAILAADVAGYSRLMDADEEGVLARLGTMTKRCWAWGLSTKCLYFPSRR